MMKFSPKENEKLHENFEPEQQFILRMPKTQSDRLREILKSKSPQLKNRLQIDVDPQEKIGKVTFDEWNMEATLVDLPTIIDSYKTLDKAVLYKTADISQMLVCKENPPDLTEKINPQSNPAYFHWKHGITPPLKNAKKRRFRKTLKKPNSDAHNIGKEIKYILQSDMIATKVEYRLIDAEPLQKPMANTEEAIFGEALTSSDDDEDDDQEGGRIHSVPNLDGSDSKDMTFEAKLEEESEIIDVVMDEKPLINHHPARLEDEGLINLVSDGEFDSNQPAEDIMQLNLQSTPFDMQAGSGGGLGNGTFDYHMEPNSSNLGHQTFNYGADYGAAPHMDVFNSYDEPGSSNLAHNPDNVQLEGFNMQQQSYGKYTSAPDDEGDDITEDI